MSAPTVSIGRLSATAHLDEARAEDATRVARLLGQVAAERLARALRDVPPPPGIWCVRQLEVPVGLDLDRPDPALEAAWAATLAGALRQTLQPGSPEVVRYDHEREALCDLVCGVATGRLGRAWAWRRLGLLQPPDPPLDRAAGEALVTVLGRHPRQALGVVVLAADRVGLAALQRALGPAGWTAVAGVVREAFGAGPARPSHGEGPGAGGGSARATAIVGGSRLADLLRGSRVRLDPRTLDALALLVVAERDPAALRRPAGDTLVAAVARALAARAAGTGTHPGPRPGPPSGTAGDPAAGTGTRVVNNPARAPGVGTGAVDDPAHRAPGTGVVDSPAQRAPEVGAGAGRGGAGAGDPAGVGGPEGSTSPAALGPAPRGNPASPREAPRRGSVADGEPTRLRMSTAPADGAAASFPASTAPADGAAASFPASTAPAEGGPATLAEGGERGRPTDWAGLLFLLATAAAAGIPDAVLDDQVLAARPLPWALQGIALRLVPATVQDPAVAAFAGADPAGPPPWRLGPPAGDDELARLDLAAHRWATVTAAALAEPERDPLDVVASIARRGGLVDYAPGWLEVRLDIDQVDVAVRRAGLDLDPGWVPWLGTVVRFVYA